MGLSRTMNCSWPQRRILDNPHIPALTSAIADMADICQGMSIATDDPLGIGGLLSDSMRIAQLTIKRGSAYDNLLESLLGSGLRGVDYFKRGGSLELPAGYRLAFRELGLSIGLSAAEFLPVLVKENPLLFRDSDVMQRQTRYSGGTGTGQEDYRTVLDGGIQPAGRHLDRTPGD